jgi:hypothetical protein
MKGTWMNYWIKMHLLLCPHLKTSIKTLPLSYQVRVVKTCKTLTFAIP